MTNFDSTGYIINLSDAIESQNKSEIEVEVDGKYLHIYMNGKEYLMYWHDVLNQMWLSSPESGAHHFEPNQDGKLCSTRDSEVILEQLLEDELGIKL